MTVIMSYGPEKSDLSNDISGWFAYCCNQTQVVSISFQKKSEVFNSSHALGFERNFSSIVLSNLELLLCNYLPLREVITKPSPAV